MITLGHFLAVGAALFGLGLVGFMTRRNLITMFLSAELMLQEAEGPGRRFRTAPLQHPYGRGMNMQIEVDDAHTRHR